MYICTNYDGMAFFEPLSSFFRSNYLSRDYVSVENFCIVLKSFEPESKKKELCNKDDLSSAEPDGEEIELDMD